MNFKKMTEILSNIPNEQSVLLLGPPGTGKTQLARTVGENLGPGAIVEVRDLCSHLPEDLLGLPFRNGESTIYAPPEWLFNLSKPGIKGVLVLDDLSAATASVQVAAMRLLLERSSGSCKISPGIKIIATANRKEDKSGALTLPAALRNRCLILELQPSLDEWCSWAIDNNIPTDITSYLRFQPSHFSRLPKDTSDNGAFATPRSWAMLGRCKPPEDEDVRVEVASGFVGDGVATQFNAFVKCRRELKDPVEILNNPNIVEHISDAQKLIAVISSVSETAANLTKTNAATKLGKEWAYKFLVALSHIAGARQEYMVVGLETFTSCKGHEGSLGLVAKENRNDPKIKTILDFMTKAFKS